MLPRLRCLLRERTPVAAATRASDLPEVAGLPVRPTAVLSAALYPVLHHPRRTVVHVSLRSLLPAALLPVSASVPVLSALLSLSVPLRRRLRRLLLRRRLRVLLPYLPVLSAQKPLRPLLPAAVQSPVRSSVLPSGLLVAPRLRYINARRASYVPIPYSLMYYRYYYYYKAASFLHRIRPEFQSPAFAVAVRICWNSQTLYRAIC